LLELYDRSHLSRVLSFSSIFSSSNSFYTHSQFALTVIFYTISIRLRLRHQAFALTSLLPLAITPHANILVIEQGRSLGA